MATRVRRGATSTSPPEPTRRTSAGLLANTYAATDHAGPGDVLQEGARQEAREDLPRAEEPAKQCPRATAPTFPALPEDVRHRRPTSWMLAPFAVTPLDNARASTMGELFDSDGTARRNARRVAVRSSDRNSRRWDSPAERFGRRPASWSSGSAADVRCADSRPARWREPPCPAWTCPPSRGTNRGARCAVPRWPP